MQYNQFIPFTSSVNTLDTLCQVVSRTFVNAYDVLLNTPEAVFELLDRRGLPTRAYSDQFHLIVAS